MLCEFNQRKRNWSETEGAGGEHGVQADEKATQEGVTRLWRAGLEGARGQERQEMEECKLSGNLRSDSFTGMMKVQREGVRMKRQGPSVWSQEAWKPALQCWEAARPGHARSFLRRLYALFLGPFSSPGSELWFPNGVPCTMTFLYKMFLGQGWNENNWDNVVRMCVSVKERLLSVLFWRLFFLLKWCLFSFLNFFGIFRFFSFTRCDGVEISNTGIPSSSPSWQWEVTSPPPFQRWGNMTGSVQSSDGGIGTLGAEVQCVTPRLEHLIPGALFSSTVLPLLPRQMAELP